MKKIIKVTVVLIVTMLVFTNNAIANEDNPVWVKDYGNFVKESNEDKIWDISDKVEIKKT